MGLRALANSFRIFLLLNLMEWIGRKQFERENSWLRKKKEGKKRTEIKSNRDLFNLQAASDGTIRRISKFWIEMGPSISISILGPHLVQILWSSTKLNYNSIKHHYGYRAKKSTTNLPFGLQRAKCISGDRGEGESGTLAIYDFIFDRVLRRSAILCALMAFFLSFFFLSGSGLLSMFIHVHST